MIEQDGEAQVMPGDEAGDRWKRIEAHHGGAQAIVGLDPQQRIEKAGLNGAPLLPRCPVVDQQHALAVTQAHHTHRDDRQHHVEVGMGSRRLAAQ